MPSFIPKMAALINPLHQALPLRGYLQWLDRTQEEVGMRMAPLEFLVIQEMAALAGLIVYIATHGVSDIQPAVLALFVIGGCLIPVFWLKRRIAIRRQTVGRDLPEVVDLLALSVSAGTDLMSAISHVLKEFRPCPVVQELGVVLSEVRVGKRRRDALRGFARRLQTPEASTFSRTLIQADRMGTGLVEALKVLSEDMRLQRYHWAERFAQQAPIKMLLPLIISLASAMLIVTAPILIQFFRGGFMDTSQMMQPK
ncbi:type II secretion system F family protein [Candidatus Uhrbacteria bacterium]|nr:type II secretion system F family protein [Candidatus Uhrbacteria bacterium]